MVSPSEKAFPVSWDQFHRDARALAWRLASAGPFEAIVAITRGGLVPAAIVARELNVRVIETICIASYHDYKNQGGLQVLKTIAAEIARLDDGAKILIVDDLVDTGATGHKRDKSRMAGHPLGGPAGYHRGHAVPNQMGGGTDINLVAQKGSVNLDRDFRSTERRAAANPGALYFTYWVYATGDGVRPKFVQQGLLLPGSHDLETKFYLN